MRDGMVELDQLRTEIDKKDAEIERLRSALEEIGAWASAYPLASFPEPDFAKAAELLAAGDMTLDAISASNMRHVLQGVGEIARKALGGSVGNQTSV
jgi:hypothetical protein